MSDSSNWSLPIGRLGRVQVRLHAIFVATAIFALFLSVSQPGRESPGYGLLSIAVLFFSVLAHELGHCWAATRVGGTADLIVLGPLGGMHPVEAPRESQPELITALAGPLVNLCILLVTWPLLLAAQVDFAGLLSPLQPTDLLSGSWPLVTIKFAFWFNWLLLLVNLLPACPFDCARILRTMLHPALDYRTAGQVVVRASKLTALAVCVAAYLMKDGPSSDVFPAWVPLALFATYIFFSAQQQGMRSEEHAWDEDAFSYDFSQGYTSLEPPHEPQRRSGSSMRRWLENRLEMRRRRRRWQEQEEERQVDAILIRLHENGLDGLSAKERALLERVSARYRNRQQN